MSLAQAILEYIHDKIGAKTMFSTHYHELTDLSNSLKHLQNVHVSAVEEDGKLTFLHKIKLGAVDKSYGLNVASLAHLPESLIKRAEEILNIYESEGTKEKQFTQTSLFSLDTLDRVLKEEEKKNEIEETIKEVDPLNMTPINALNFLYELKEKIRNEEK